MTPEEFARKILDEKLARHTSTCSRYGRSLALLDWPEHALEESANRRGWTTLLALREGRREEVCEMLTLDQPWTVEEVKKQADTQIRRELMDCLGPGWAIFFDSFVFNQGCSHEEINLRYAGWKKLALESVELLRDREALALVSAGPQLARQ